MKIIDCQDQHGLIYPCLRKAHTRKSSIVRRTWSQTPERMGEALDSAVAKQCFMHNKQRKNRDSLDSTRYCMTDHVGTTLWSFWLDCCCRDTPHICLVSQESPSMAVLVTRIWFGALRSKKDQLAPATNCLTITGMRPFSNHHCRATQPPKHCPSAKSLLCCKFVASTRDLGMKRISCDDYWDALNVEATMVVQGTRCNIVNRLKFILSQVHDKHERSSG